MLVAASVRAQTPSLDDLAWMTGSWETQLGRARIEEHWLAPAGKSMFGISRTVAGDRTVSFEFLRIETRPDGIYYVAQPNGRPGTDFKLTSLTGGLAVFENPAHDHPKIIRYRRNADGSLLASIEGDEKGKHVVQDFPMQKSR
jgi:hypothetical protein